MTQAVPTVPRLEGRYVVSDEIAAGGTATVHFGRLLGQGFARTVAIKRLHPTYARDPVFVSMFRDEARLATRIHHPNVCAILDVITVDEDPYLVLDYVHGEPLFKLIDAAESNNELVPYDIAAGIVSGMLQGLHAAHEATDEAGEPLHIIHRDVSPQNVLVGADGVPRVVDFGMAKAMGRLQNTAEGQLKGKLGYMAPEQFSTLEIDRRVDVYAAAVVLWETLTGQFLFERTAPSTLMRAILEGEIRPPSALVPGLPAEIDAVCMRGLSRDPADRFATAQDMAVAIETAIMLPSPREIGAWVKTVAGDVLQARAKVLARIEAEHPSALSIPPSFVDDKVESNTPSRTSRKRQVALGLVITIITTVLILYITVWDRSAPPAQTTPAHQAAAGESAPAVVSARESPAEPKPTPAELPSEQLPKAVVPSARVAGSASTVTSVRRQKPRSRCEPPYVIGKDGIRHPKRECLFLNPAR